MSKKKSQDAWKGNTPAKLTKGLKRQLARVERQNEAEARSQRSAITGGV